MATAVAERLSYPAQVDVHVHITAYKSVETNKSEKFILFISVSIHPLMDFLKIEKAYEVENNAIK